MKKALFTITTVVLGVIGIIAPIIWDQYKTRTGLELQLLAKTVILNKEAALEKLEIRYDNKPIQNISQISFALVNTGKKPILAKDLITPPTLIFQEGAEILDAIIEHGSPKNLEATFTINNQKRTIEIRFPLLNPSDVVKFNVIVGGRMPAFEANARIYDIKDLSILDRTKELDKQPRRRSWTVYTVSVFTTFCLLLLLGGALPDWRARFAISKYLQENNYEFPKYDEPVDYATFVNKSFPYLSARKQVQLMQFIWNNKTQQANEKAIFELLYLGTSLTAATVVFTIISLVGIYYFVSNF